MVPIGRDLAAFESTLISVLENRPQRCEILVSHDGSYDDPFELCDEVRFVIGPTGRLVDLVKAGATDATARFVHVISDGLRATPGWTDEAIEKFEQFDAGVVTPVIRQTRSSSIVAAGWFDGRDRLCQPAMNSKRQIDRYPEIPVGAYLQASFWRTEVLRSVGDACRGLSSAEANSAYDHLIRAAGWASVLATDCTLLCDGETVPWDSSSLRRGQQLRAVRNHFSGGGWMTSLLGSLRAGLSGLVKPTHLAEAMGQASAPLSQRHLRRQLTPQRVVRPDDQPVLVTMPPRDGRPGRQAA